MRVLHIGKFYPPFHGGIENFLAALVRAQLDQGLDVGVLAHSHAPDGLPTYRRATPGEPLLARVPCYGRILYAPISPAFPRWLNRALKDFNPDVLHLHLPNTSAFWALVSLRARQIPWVIHWHSDVVESTIDRRLAVAYHAYRPFEQALLRRASRVIATSPPYLETSKALSPWRGKCHVVPLGLATIPTVADESLQEVGDGPWEPGLLRVLAIGRLTYYKGFDILVRAAAMTPFVQVIIVGDGEQRDDLQHLCTTSDARARLRLVGGLSQAQLESLQTSCDVFCLPSLERTEAFGVVLLEAMQRAKPVVASAIPGSGVGWVIQHEKTGLLFPVGDSNEAAACFEQLNDKSLRLRLGIAGRHRFEDTFRIDGVAKEITAIYKRVVSGLN